MTRPNKENNLKTICIAKKIQEERDKTVDYDGRDKYETGSERVTRSNGAARYIGGGTVSYYIAPFSLQLATMLSHAAHCQTATETFTWSNLRRTLR